MSFRPLLIGCIVIGVVLGYAFATWPPYALGTVKDDLVRSAAESGIDVSECREKKSLFDPNGGTAKCATGIYREIRRKLEEDDEPSEYEGPSEDSSSEE